jgi:pimeloyl-ACP methyl ester carboxylesterase
MKINNKTKYLTGLMGLVLVGCASNSPLPVTHAQPSKVLTECNTSFWQDCVQYAYSVNYAQVQDRQGADWKIAYMDEYVASAENPPIVVLVHGKGMFGGYFAELMTDLLAQGYRVIVPDLPNYGKSIPGNLANSTLRSLDDTRDAIHDLLTNKLGIGKASFLGHSMGGQWVVGYALDYPEQVDKIILEAPGGLEEFPSVIANIPFFGEQQQQSDDNWQAIWGNALAKERSKTAEDTYLFNYFQRKNPKTGAIELTKSGYFLVKNAQTEYITQVRQKMATATPAEFQAWSKTYIRDVYSMGSEVIKGDANNLVQRIDEIKSPILITYGEQEPFIPTTVFSGNQDLRWDVIKPVYDRLAAAGNAPEVKVYPGVGHFIHTDAAQLFTADVVDFLADGQIDDTFTEDVSDYKAPQIATPKDVQLFLNNFKTALLARDKTAIASFYSDDFLENGYGKTEFLNVLFGQLKNVQDYQVSLVQFDEDSAKPKEYFIQGLVNLGSIKMPFQDGSKVRNSQQGWQWIGNQK